MNRKIITTMHTNNYPLNSSATKRHSVNASIYKEQVRQTTMADSYPLLAPVAITLFIAIAFNIIASTPFYEGLILALS